MDDDKTRRIEKLEAELDMALGRLNAIYVLVAVIARELPPEIAAKCVANARGSVPHIDANLIASSLPEKIINEMQRVLDEGVAIFEAAANHKEVS